ncbi:hypothetical protein [Cystobacter ferrugineus]|nr:hypothetical protein [Cystobacter ferrugineus]
MPSHGPVGGMEFIPPYRTFLTTIRDRTTAAKKAGRTVDEATADITAELSGRYPDPMRLGWAVKAAHAELQ